VDTFLLNQTTLFLGRTRGPLYRALVDHRPHTIQPIQGIVEANTLLSALGLTAPPDPPRLSYSPGDDSRAWRPARVR
jgi:uncharacterized protein YqjF (DUF2071 family)